MKKILGIVAAILAVQFFLAGVCHADGKYFPRPGVVKEPAIPHQRALITFKDGIETMVIESAVESESPELGWVIPIPAEPTKLEVADPGLLNSLQFTLLPIVHTARRYEIWKTLACMLATAIIPTIAIAMGLKRKKEKPAVIVRDWLLIWLLMFLLIWSIFIPSLGTAGSSIGTGPQVKVLSAQPLGRYDATVLKATNSQALSEWLTAASLRGLNDAEKPIVDDYIKQGWCFVVAKIATQAGTVAPHPIMIRFPISHPVYPMRLTALSGAEKTKFDLYIAADMRAKIDGFECEWSDNMRYYDHELTERIQDDNGKPPTVKACQSAGYHATFFPQDGIFWNGCVLTKLTATLRPDQQTNDLKIGFESPSTYRQSLHAKGSKMSLAILVTMVTLIITLAICAIWLMRSKGNPPIWKLLIVAAAIPLLAGGISWLTVQEVDVTDVRHNEMNLRLAICDSIENGTCELTSNMTDEQIAELKRPGGLEKLFGKEIPVNSYTGQPVRCERSPGNFTIERIDDKAVICIYGDHYYADKISLMNLPDKLPTTAPAK